MNQENPIIRATDHQKMKSLYKIIPKGISFGELSNMQEDFALVSSRCTFVYYPASG